MLRAARARLANESGFTLIELLTTMLIGIVVLSAALGLTEVGARSTSKTTDRADTTQRARTVMNHIVQGLRSQVCRDSATPPIVAGSDTSITYYGDIDSSPYFGPQKRELTYSAAGGGSIVEKLWTPSSGPPWIYPATPSRTRTLIDQVGLDGTTPFLRYYPFDGTTALDADPELSTDTTSDPLPGNSIARVLRIDVSFEARPSSGNVEQARRADRRATVYLRNSDYTDLSTTDAKRDWGPRCD